MARRTAADILRHLIAAVPYEVHTVLTDNGTQFTTPGNTSSAAPDIRAALDAGEPFTRFRVRLRLEQHGSSSNQTEASVDNGQVERMNRTIKDATVKRFYYETHDQLRTHLADFVTAYRKLEFLASRCNP